MVAGKVHDLEGILAKWATFARNTFHRYCKAAPDPGSSQGVTEIITSCSVGKLKGQKSGSGPFVGAFYSCGSSGEPTARPHWRVVHFRESHCTRMTQGALEAASDHGEFPEGNIFIMADGKQLSNIDRMHKVFADSNGKPLPKKKQQLHVMTTEESERETRERMVGVATLTTMEFLNMYTAQALCVPFRKRLTCGGTSGSDTLGPPGEAEERRALACQAFHKEGALRRCVG